MILERLRQRYAVVEAAGWYRLPVTRRYWTRRGAQRAAARYTARAAQLRHPIPIDLRYIVARRV